MLTNVILLHCLCALENADNNYHRNGAHSYFIRYSIKSVGFFNFYAVLISS